MDLVRRTLLKGMGSAGILSALLSAGLLTSTGAWAAEWNRSAFESKDAAAALKAFGFSGSSESKDVVIKTKDITENGAFVPVEVISNVPNTVSIAIVVEKNPFPLSVAFDFLNGALPEVTVRLKFAQTSNVKAVAKTSDGKYFHAQREVKTTVGGCG